MTDATKLAREALVRARDFIHNGIELGFIRMPDPDTPDPAHETPRLIDEALAALSTAPGERVALREAVERVILRRLHKNRIDGYTLEMAEEIAALSTAPGESEGARARARAFLFAYMNTGDDFLTEENVARWFASTPPAVPGESGDWPEDRFEDSDMGAR